MKRFLREFEVRYRSVENYLEVIGVKEEVINNIKNNYVKM